MTSIVGMRSDEDSFEGTTLAEAGKLGPKEVLSSVNTNLNAALIEGGFRGLARAEVALKGLGKYILYTQYPQEAENASEWKEARSDNELNGHLKEYLENAGVILKSVLEGIRDEEIRAAGNADPFGKIRKAMSPFLGLYNDGHDEGSALSTHFLPAALLMLERDPANLDKYVSDWVEGYGFDYLALSDPSSARSLLQTAAKLFGTHILKYTESGATYAEIEPKLIQSREMGTKIAQKMFWLAKSTAEKGRFDEAAMLALEGFMLHTRVPTDIRIAASLVAETPQHSPKIYDGAEKRLRERDELYEAVFDLATRYPKIIGHLPTPFIKSCEYNIRSPETVGALMSCANIIAITGVETREEIVGVVELIKSSAQAAASILKSGGADSYEQRRLEHVLQMSLATYSHLVLFIPPAKYDENIGIIAGGIVETINTLKEAGLANTEMVADLAEQLAGNIRLVRNSYDDGFTDRMVEELLELASVRNKVSKDE